MPLFEISQAEYDLILEMRERKQEEDFLKSQGLWVEDGFGTECSIFCETCGEPTVYVNRPGDFRCSTCQNRDFERRLAENPELYS